MSFKMMGQTDKMLLDRKEIRFEAVFTGAVPSREELRKKIAVSEGTNENVVVIKNIYPFAGTGKAKVLAYVYKSEDALKKIEYGYILNRGKPKQAGEQKTEQKAEQKAEAKKEEPKKEEHKKGEAKAA